MSNPLDKIKFNINDKAWWKQLPQKLKNMYYKYLHINDGKGIYQLIENIDNGQTKYEAAQKLISMLNEEPFKKNKNKILSRIEATSIPGAKIAEIVRHMEKVSEDDFNELVENKNKLLSTFPKQILNKFLQKSPARKILKKLSTKVSPKNGKITKLKEHEMAIELSNLMNKKSENIKVKIYEKLKQVSLGARIVDIIEQRERVNKALQQLNIKNVSENINKKLQEGGIHAINHHRTLENYRDEKHGSYSVLLQIKNMLTRLMSGFRKASINEKRDYASAIRKKRKENESAIQKEKQKNANAETLEKRTAFTEALKKIFERETFKSWDNMVTLKKGKEHYQKKSVAIGDVDQEYQEYPLELTLSNNLLRLFGKEIRNRERAERQNLKPEANKILSAQLQEIQTKFPRFTKNMLKAYSITEHRKILDQLVEEKKQRKKNQYQEQKKSRWFG